MLTCDAKYTCEIKSGMDMAQASIQQEGESLYQQTVLKRNKETR
jgi:hypothetical protein